MSCCDKKAAESCCPPPLVEEKKDLDHRPFFLDDSVSVHVKQGAFASPEVRVDAHAESPTKAAQMAAEAIKAFWQFYNNPSKPSA